MLTRFSAFCAFLLSLLLSIQAFAASPSITSLSPTFGGAGVSVTITGTNFGSSRGSSTVTFNGTAATSITSWNATTIKATVPTGATTGNVVVTVGGVASNGQAFTVTAPSISSLSPTSAGAGASVTITGTGFGSSQGSSSVTFNGTTATTITSWNATTIKSIVPTGASTGNMIVTVGGLASNGSSFTVTAPSISGLSPSSGAVGTSVSVNGSGFGSSQGSSSVAFNGTAATPASWTATKIIAPASAGATTGNVVVTVAGTASNGKNFTVQPTPAMGSISPTFGAVGIVVTITGSNFGTTQGSSTVKFNGVTATPTAWSASQITVPVPSGATSGNVVVHASGVDTNGLDFNVLTISSIAVTPANLSLPLNSVQQYTATATYSDNSTQSLGSNATWSTSDTTIATTGNSGVVTGGGQGQATIQAAFGSVNGSTALTVNGSSFVPVGDLNVPRYDHTATLLPNGKVLIVGGQAEGSNVLDSAELYDPTTQTFTLTGSLATERRDHTATLLPNGMVLIAGGSNFLSDHVSLSSTELYNPATGTFSAGPKMNSDHYGHTATLLGNGKVLIAGGRFLIATGDGGNSPSELYDPTAGTFTYTTGQLLTPRTIHTATLLNDGTVLIAGGEASGNPLASAEIYNPATDTFTATGSLNVAREGQTATLLNNGEVLMAEGTLTSPASEELYDPGARTFSITGSLALARTAQAAALLQSGSPLIVGGQEPDGTNTGTAELFNPTSQSFTGAGSLEVARWGHTATTLNDGTVLVAGGITFLPIAQAELYLPNSTEPAPYSLRITPTGVNMLVGGTQQFTVVNNLGFPRTDATWSVDNSSLATISSDSSPILTALAPGQVTLTATIDSVSAQTQVTISSSSSFPPGTALWSAPAVGGFSPLSLVQAVPSGDNGPDLYSVQASADGTQSIVQALTADGQQMWQASLPIVNGNSTPDGNGGLIVTEYNTCTTGQTNPMTVVDLDGLTGQPIWEVQAAGLQEGNNVVYCYPDTIPFDDEPKIAVRGDGSIVVAAMTNNGLPPVTISDGTEISLTPSTCEDGSGNQFNCFSIEGPPIVNTDGNTYMEYQVRQSTDPSNPSRITSATLYLLEIGPGPDDGSSSIQLSSTTDNTNLLPGRIIPDGQGGVIATWTISPVTGPVPTNPFQAAHVVSGAVAATYDLPFSPAKIIDGQYPTLVLGESGTAFVTDGMDSTNGPQIASFDLSSGAVNWSYPATAGNELSFIASASGNGLAAKLTSGGVDNVIRFDSTGAATADPWTGTGIDYFIGDLWTGVASGSAAVGYSAAPVNFSSTGWFAPEMEKSNKAVQTINVTNFSNTGPNQVAIQNVLQQIVNALPSNAACNNWLQGTSGLSGLTYMQTLLQNNTLVGHGAFDVRTSAFTGVGLGSTGVPNGTDLTVNDNGAFFLAGTGNLVYLVGVREYQGGTLRAQATILIHETAHGILAPGFLKDNGIPKAGKANDKLVDKNCRQLIEGLK